MVSRRVRDLSNASVLTGGEFFYADDGSADVKVTATQIKTFANTASADFLSLTDTPNSYAGFGGTFNDECAFVKINQAASAVEFQYSTPQYLDLRDYGTVAGGGGDITAAWVAAIADANNTNHNTILIPMVGDGKYTLDASATGFLGEAWVFLFDCEQITLTGQLKPASGTTWRGLRKDVGNNHVANVVPRPTITANNAFGGGPTGAAVYCNNVRNILFENLVFTAYNGNGNAFYASGGDTLAFKNCVFTSAGPGNPCHIDSIFWFTMEECSFFPNSSGIRKGLKLSTETNHGTDCGIGRFRDIRFDTAGIEFVCVYSGGLGVDNMKFTQVATETFADGNALFNFNSSGSISGSIVGYIFAEDFFNADPTGLSYYISNVGSLTQDIFMHFEAVELDSSSGLSGGVVDPASDVIKGLWIDIQQAASGGTRENIGSAYEGAFNWYRWQMNTVDSYSGKLVTAPIGLPVAIGTPLAVSQDGTGWTGAGGPTITTTGIYGPDGTTNAVQVSGGTNTTIFTTSSLNVTTGDYLLAGCWVKGTVPVSKAPSECQFTLSVSSGSLNGTALNDWHNTFGSDATENAGWYWMSGLFRITAGADTTPTINWKCGSTSMQYFNPTLIYIPLASVDGMWLQNYARSWRGGVDPSAVAGDVALPRNQNLMIKGKYVALQGKQTIWIPASAMTSRVTNGAAAVTREIASVSVANLAFDTTTQEGANFSVTFPKSWNAGTVTFRHHWTAASGSGTVQFDLNGGSFADNVGIGTGGLGTAVGVLDTLLAADRVHVSSESSAITLSNAAVDVPTMFMLVRNVATDTLGVDAELIGIELFYTTNASNDA